MKSCGSAKYIIVCASLEGKQLPSLTNPHPSTENPSDDVFHQVCQNLHVTRLGLDNVQNKRTSAMAPTRSLKVRHSDELDNSRRLAGLQRTLKVSHGVKGQAGVHAPDARL